MVRVSEGLSAPPAQLVTRLLHRRTKRAPGYISLGIPDPRRLAPTPSAPTVPAGRPDLPDPP